MAVNTSRAWTGSTIAPQVTPATAPAIGATNIPAAVTSNVLPQGNFYNSLLSSLFGMGGGQGGGAPSGPQMSAYQNQAIANLIQQIGSENWRRDSAADASRFFSPAPLGTGGIPGVSPFFAPMGGGVVPFTNPFVEQSLSNARLFPSMQLGTAAAGFGSGGGAPARTSSGWVASPWGI